MVPGKPGGFAAPPRGQNPLSSSGQTALYSGRPAGEGIPHTAPLPLLFPAKPASLGFCGVPLSEEKEKALFDGVKRKRLGGGIPDFVRNARGACYGGLARWWPVVWTTQPHMSMKKLGAFPDALCFSFCCRTLAVGDSWAPSY